MKIVLLFSGKFLIIYVNKIIVVRGGFIVIDIVVIVVLFLKFFEYFIKYINISNC